MNFRSRRGSSSSSTELPLVAGLGLALLFACSNADDDAAGDDAAAGTGGSAAGQTGKGGTTASGGQAGKSTAGTAGSATAGSSGTSAGGGGKGQGGTGVSGTGTSGTSPGGAGSGGGSAGSAPAAGNGGSSAGGSSAGRTGGGEPGTPGIHYVGRVDTSDPDAAKFAWSGTGAIVRFNGTSASVELGGGQEYTVVVDGEVQDKLVATSGMNQLAEGLSPGEHTVELYRRTEAQQGVAQIGGFDFAGGELLAPPAVTRRLEFIGDSITCGYGNEGPDMSCPFTPQTENHYLTYGAITARNLNAELSTVAWSGKGVVCNYGDDASSCTNPLPTYYDRILPDDANSQWDFSRFQPDAVVVNLGTNDFSTSDDPDEPTFEGAYRDLLEHLREVYPNAHILCTNGPMLSNDDLTRARLYIENVVAELADPKISSFEIAPQDGSDGYGCDWHPSLERHEKMAMVVTEALREALGW
ncbi:MAG TPA: SGNH/GDSL hydrolase family protein [Polyangiaceae bacterium]